MRFQHHSPATNAIHSGGQEYRPADIRQPL
jgi:hypothetical protein